MSDDNKGRFWLVNEAGEMLGGLEDRASVKGYLQHVAEPGTYDLYSLQETGIVVTAPSEEKNRIKAGAKLVQRKRKS